MVRTLDTRLSVTCSNPGHDIAWLFLRQVTAFGGQTILGYDHHLGKLSLSSSRVAKSSTSFGWGKVGKVTAASCDPVWHVISCSVELPLRTAISVPLPMPYLHSRSHFIFLFISCMPSSKLKFRICYSSISAGLVLSLSVFL